MEVFYTEVLGLKTRYFSYGEGPVLIALPGVPFSMKIYYRLAPLIRNHRFIGLDIPGFAGETECSDEKHNADLYVKFIRAFVLKMDIQRPHLMGVSYGGMLSMRYAKQYPEDVDKLILLSPAYNGKEIQRKAFSGSRRRRLYGYLVKNYDFPRHVVIRLLKSRFMKMYYLNVRYPELKTSVDKELLQEIYGDAQKIENAPLIELAEEFFETDYSVGLDKVTNRTLVLGGSKDIVISVDECRRLATEILHNSQYCQIAGGDHAFVLTHAEDVAFQVNSFLS